MNSTLIAILTVLIAPLLIVLLSRSNKYKQLAKKHVTDQELLSKYYPSYDPLFRFAFSPPIIVGAVVMVDAIGKEAAITILIGALIVYTIALNESFKFLVKKAHQKEAEGAKSYKANMIYIKTYYPKNQNIRLFFYVVMAGIFGAFLLNISAIHLLGFGSIFFWWVVPFDHWVHHKLLEKAKLKEQALTK